MGIPLPALNVQGAPPPQAGPLDQLGQLMSLRRLAQSNQAGQLELDAAKRQEEEQKKLAAAFKEAGGDYKKTLELYEQRGGDPQLALKVRESLAQDAEKRRQLADKDLEAALKVNGLIGQATKAILSLPEAERANSYKVWRQQILAAAPQLAQQVPAEYPGDEAAEFYGLAATSAEKQYQLELENRKLKAPTSEMRELTDFRDTWLKAKGLTKETMTAADDLALRREFYAQKRGPGSDFARYQAQLEQEKGRPLTSTEMADAKKKFQETPLTQFNLNQKTAEEAEIEVAAKALAAGDLTRLRDITSFRGAQRLRVFSRAKELNPDFNLAEVDRKIRMEDYYANGKGADNLRSFDIFLQHAGAAKDAIRSIQTTNSRLANRSVNWWRQNMSSSPELVSLMGALEPVRKELESFLLGGRALYADDRREAEKILNDASTVAEVDSALTRMAHTATARLEAENQRYRRVMGQDLRDPISLEALDGAEKLGVPIKLRGQEMKGEGPAGHVLMVAPDGSEAWVPEANVAAAESKGAKRKQ